MTDWKQDRAEAEMQRAEKDKMDMLREKRSKEKEKRKKKITLILKKFEAWATVEETEKIKSLLKKEGWTFESMESLSSTSMKVYETQSAIREEIVAYDGATSYHDALANCLIKAQYLYITQK